VYLGCFAEMAAGGARQNGQIGANFEDVAPTIDNYCPWLSSLCRGRWVVLALASAGTPRWQDRSRWLGLSYPLVQRSSRSPDLSDRVILALARGRIVIVVVLKTEVHEIVQDATRPSVIEVSDLAFFYSPVSEQMKAERTPPPTLG
jgi:hypothetical protein